MVIVWSYYFWVHGSPAQHEAEGTELTFSVQEAEREEGGPEVRCLHLGHAPSDLVYQKGFTRSHWEHRLETKPLAHKPFMFIRNQRLAPCDGGGSER